MNDDDTDHSRRGAGSWAASGSVLHERVLAVAFDRLTRQLVELHAPIDDGGEQPVCGGCDQPGVSDDLAMWPCRTYTLLAASVLDLRTYGVDEYLTALRDGRRVPRPERKAAGQTVSSGLWPTRRSGGR